jgi:hypothetical protein
MQAARNDPCPCGSGKKYKNCCMLQDRIKASRDLSLSEAEGYLLNALYTYAQVDRFQYESSESFALYWGGRFDLNNIDDLDAEDMRRTMEWYVHDYHTRSEGRHIIDLFAAEKAREYPEALQAMLTAWSASVTGLFRVLSVGAGGQLDLFDCLRRENLVVSNDMLARTAHESNLLIGRLFEMGGVKRLSLMTMILPKDYEPGLVDYVTNAYGIYHDTHPQATWSEFLRENGHIFHAYLLSPKAEALRPLIGPGTPFHDPAVVREKLRAHTAERAKEVQAQKREAERAERAEGPVHRTRTGIILPGAVEQPKQTGKPEEAKPKPKILIPGRDL